MGEIHTLDHPIVGRLRWRAAGEEVSGAPIELLDGFEQANIARVLIPQLQGVLDGRTDAAGNRFNGPTKFYQPAIAQLLAAFAEIEAQGLKNRLLSFEGSFNARLKRRRGGGPVHEPSNHSFGTAFDINADFNGQGNPPAPIGSRGSVRELVPIFERHGFRWGGLFTTPDGMHFEVAKLV